MSAVGSRRRWRGLGLGAQLSLLSIVVFFVTLASGGYAIAVLQTYQKDAVQDAALDELAAAELTVDELNQSLRADVFARYAGMTGNDRATDHLRRLQTVVVRLSDEPDERIRQLATDEFYFANTAQRLLTGPTPTGTDVARFRTLADDLEVRVDEARQRITRISDERDQVREHFTRQALYRLALVAGSSALLLLFLAWLIRNRLLAALRKLARTAEAVAAGDLSARTGRAGDDEVGQLAHVLDETSDTLQRAFAEREADARRQAFRARLDRALAQVDDDEGLAETVGRALQQVVPHRPTEILIADSSEAHLETYTTNPVAEAPGCQVSTPWSCPAVRGGRVAEFASSTELDACPHLRGRPEGDRSGVCIPISFMGRVLGVLHSAAGPDDLPDSDQMYQLRALTEQTGARLGNLRAFDQVQRQAAVDSLTGLPNRRSFEDSVHRLAGKGVPYGLMLADLDHFKSVNDTYGHAAGDRALRLFADTLRTVLREHDLPCRFGGEEFAVVVPEVDVVGASEVADRIRMALAVAVVGSGPAFTVSVGVSDSTMARDLAGQLALADAALLAAKREGRDRCLIASPTIAQVGVDSIR